MKYRVGQTVIVTRNMCGHGFYPGEKIIIDNIEEASSFTASRKTPIASSKWSSWWIGPDEIKPLDIRINSNTKIL